MMSVYPGRVGQLNITMHLDRSTRSEVWTYALSIRVRGLDESFGTY